MPGEPMEFNNGERKAAEISRRIQSGEAANEQQAREQMQLEADPKSYLQTFGNTPIQTKIRNDWRPGLAAYIQARLKDKPPNDYLDKLDRLTAAGIARDILRQNVFTAAVLYELKHQGEMKETGKYYRAKLFRLALPYAFRRRGVSTPYIQSALERGLQEVSLEDLEAVFKNRSKRRFLI